jgi:hypothetical protein
LAELKSDRHQQDRGRDDELYSSVAIRLWARTGGKHLPLLGQTTNLMLKDFRTVREGERVRT